MSPCLTLPAFAKINLSLRILGKRADGYHNLDTIFQTISLHDNLIVSPTDKSEVEFSCDDRKLPVDENNLVIRAAEALRTHFDLKQGARIRLEKRIPVQAGLGGGSSDAAVTLLALKRLWKLSVVTEDLIEIGSRIGADVPFFFYGGTARGTAAGAEIVVLPDAPETFLLIVKPNANIRTSDAYKLWDERSLTTPDSKTILSSSQSTANFDNAGFDALHNDFAEIAFALEPEILRAKAALLSAGAHTALLSGSGSAVFGVFDSSDAQRRAIQTIALETGWRVFPCKTLARHDYQSACGHLFELLA
jgi:4-diphosphocytidyl-2-C-methyl-D-erythritol kinase